MNYYKRAVLADFHSKLKPNKVLILLGARRVGKTQLIKKYLEEHIPKMDENTKCNSFDLISEYNIKWQIYVASMLELDS